MLLVVWEYKVGPEHSEEFEAFYRPDGPWVDLFHRTPGYVSTTLMRDIRDPLRYLISDRWSSLEAYEHFRAEHATAYAALEERGRRLYLKENEVGRFDFLD
jgi:heme-degrading monooxygenase HmoA